jgi:hypothetical protein
MQSEAPYASDQGLPPVVPPTGGFLARLFLVPLLIVSAVVGLLLLVNWLVGSARTPADFLKRLDSANPDVRWRGAEDLAQVLLRDDTLASDPHFALDLADRLRTAWQEGLAQDKAMPPETTKTPLPGWSAHAAHDPAREFALYMESCLGNVVIPVGAPLLAEIAVARDGDNSREAPRRWQALWALASLGENIKRFAKLSPERQQAVLTGLEQEAATSGSKRADRARRALDYMRGPAKSLEALGVAKALVGCALDQNPFLREIAALALNFWEGTPAENAQLEELLAKLTRDDGHGEQAMAQLREEEGQAPESATRSPGLSIRSNAAIALARRGSDRVRLGMLEEMLNEERQEENFRLRSSDGRDTPDQATASATVGAACKAVAELHRRRPDKDLSSLYPALDALAQHPNMALRSEAERTRLALGRP